MRLRSGAVWSQGEKLSRLDRCAGAQTARKALGCQHGAADFEEAIIGAAIRGVPTRHTRGNRRTQLHRGHVCSGGGMLKGIHLNVRAQGHPPVSLRLIRTLHHAT